MFERLDAIEARRDPVGCTRHDTCSRADIHYLLDLARKQQAALAAVRELAERWAGLDNSPAARTNRLRALRAAITGEGGE